MTPKELRHVHALHATMLGGTTPAEREAARKKLEQFLKRHDKKISDVAELVAEAQKLIDAADIAKRQQREDERRAESATQPKGIQKHWDALTLLHFMVERYIDVKPHEAIGIALWILHTHVMEQLDHTPRLAMTSPMPGCGKTAVLKICGLLAHAGMRISHPSAASLNSLVEENPDDLTLLLDEADTIGLRGTGDAAKLRAFLNDGWERGGGTARQIRGASHVYASFVPVAIACIGRTTLPDALLSRAVILRMKMAAKKLETIPTLRQDHGDFDYVQIKIRAWAADVKLDPLAVPLPEPVERNRGRDNWRVLLAIADDFGEEWGARAREAACEFARLDDFGVNPCKKLLTDMRTIFNRDRLKYIKSKALVAALLDLDELWSYPPKISQARIAKMLADFDIKSMTVRIPGELGTGMGYRRTDLEDAWKRYCPTADTANTATLIPIARYAGNPWD